MDPLTASVTAGPGWEAFQDPAQYLRCGLVLMAATASGALMAFHPVHRRRPQTRADVEQRKTTIIYAVVGAMIAVVCSVNPSMAFVIFGIGGLMRFRTELAASKHTGHTIMTTLIGLCWGLGLELVAALATAYFWILFYVLERNPVVELVVGGVSVDAMGEAEAAYRGALLAAGCKVAAHQKNFKKQSMTFAISLPAEATPESVSTRLAELPADVRGTVDWIL